MVKAIHSVAGARPMAWAHYPVAGVFTVAGVNHSVAERHALWEGSCAVGRK